MLTLIADPFPDTETAELQSATQAEQQFPLFVIRHGWHVGIALKSQDVFATMPELQSRFEAHPYVELGWGDRGFYQTDKVTADITVKAILWPSESVMHVVGLPLHPEDYFINSQVQTLCLSDAQQAAILSFVRQSFMRDEQHGLITMEKGLYGDSQFYSAKGDYYWLNTCNRWTATAIAQAGFEGLTYTKLDAGSVQRWVTQLQADHEINPSCGL